MINGISINQLDDRVARKETGDKHQFVVQKQTQHTRISFQKVQYRKN
jgi:hypothetical protein